MGLTDPLLGRSLAGSQSRVSCSLHPWSHTHMQQAGGFDLQYPTRSAAVKCLDCSWLLKVVYASVWCCHWRRKGGHLQHIPVPPFFLKMHPQDYRHVSLSVGHDTMRCFDGACWSPLWFATWRAEDHSWVLGYSLVPSRQHKVGWLAFSCCTFTQGPAAKRKLTFPPAALEESSHTPTLPTRGCTGQVCY